MINVVISGASSGLGLYLAELCLETGKNVIGLSRTEGGLHALINKYPERIRHIPADLSDPGSVQRAVQGLLTHCKPDILINNAGYGQIGPLEYISFGEMENQFRVNVFGLLELTRLILPEMRARGGGRIIIIGSSAGRICSPFNGPYSASKHALEALADALRYECADSGIKVALVQPGKINTPYGSKISQSGAEILKRIPQERRKAFENFLSREEKIPGLPLHALRRKFLQILHDTDLKPRYVLDSYTRLLFLIRTILP